MMFKRKAYDALLEWKTVSDGKTAALIEGARRIGKSTVAKAFAEAEYADYLILDFSMEDETLRRIFRENIGELDAFFRNLFLLKGKSLAPGNAVIIFDEVQLFPLARQAIKALVSDGRYHYIETGSLISIKKNVQDILIPSEEHRIKMYPMDFEEFLWARGNTVAADAIREAFERLRPLGQSAHRKLLGEFRTYVAVGGMPQAVEALVEGRDFRAIDLVKRSIIDLYEEDINKYDHGPRRAAAIYKSIPEQLTHRNSHFKMAKLDKGLRYSSIEEALVFLNESMIVNECVNVTTPDVLMDLHVDHSRFKLYQADTGLLVTQAMQSGVYSEEGLYKALTFGKLSSNLGMVMENAVAQMLVANGHSLRYHEFRYQPEGSTAKKLYEIDFVVVRDRLICPIEVKSSGYRAHKSLDFFFEKYDVKCKERYVLYPKDVDRQGAVTYLPLYMAMCL